MVHPNEYDIICDIISVVMKIYVGVVDLALVPLVIW